MSQMFCTVNLTQHALIFISRKTVTLWLNGMAPSYLRELLHPLGLTSGQHSLQSTTTVPSTFTSLFQQEFSSAGPILENALDAGICTLAIENSMALFLKCLKPYVQVFPIQSNCSESTLEFLS